MQCGLGGYNLFQKVWFCTQMEFELEKLELSFGWAFITLTKKAKSVNLPNQIANTSPTTKSGSYN
jgi:hypothetical protein